MLWLFTFKLHCYLNITECCFGCACSCSVNHSACQTVTAVRHKLWRTYIHTYVCICVFIKFYVENVAKLITVLKCKNTINYVQIHRCWHVPQKTKATLCALAGCTRAVPALHFWHNQLAGAQHGNGCVRRVCRVVGNLRLPCARQTRPAARLALTAQLSCVRLAFATRGNAAILCFAWASSTDHVNSGHTGLGHQRDRPTRSAHIHMYMYTHTHRQTD